MDFALWGLLWSTLAALVFTALFSLEERRGARFLSRFRAYADVAVVRVSRLTRRILRFFGRDLIRQLGRFVYHQTLRLTLSFMRRCEEALKNAMQTNRTLAKRQEEERAVRSKLEEVAYHKATTALSEEEKRRHRNRVLEG